MQAGMELSALVNYIQPVRFHTFDYAESMSFILVSCFNVLYSNVWYYVHAFLSSTVYFDTF